MREATIGEVADECGKCGEEAILHSALLASGARRYMMDEEGLEIDGIFDQLGDENTVGAKEAGETSFDDGEGLSSRQIAIEKHVRATPGAEISRRPDRVEQLFPERACKGLLADDGKRIGGVELRTADDGAVRVLQDFVRGGVGPTRRVGQPALPLLELEDDLRCARGRSRMLADQQDVTAPARGRTHASEVATRSHGAAVALGPEAFGVATGDAGQGAKQVARIDGPIARVGAGHREFVACDEILAEETESLGSRRVAAEPLVELSQVGDDVARVDGLSDANVVQIDENGARRGAILGLDDDVAGVHVEVVEAALMGAGDEAGRTLSDQSSAVGVVAAGEPVVAKGDGARDCASQQEGGTGPETGALPAAGNGQHRVDSMSGSIVADLPLQGGGRASEQGFRPLGEGLASVSLDEYRFTREVDAPNVAVAIAFDAGNARTLSKV